MQTRAALLKTGSGEVGGGDGRVSIDRATTRSWSGSSPRGFRALGVEVQDRDATPSAAKRRAVAAASLDPPPVASNAFPAKRLPAVIPQPVARPTRPRYPRPGARKPGRLRARRRRLDRNAAAVGASREQTGDRLAMLVENARIGVDQQPAEREGERRTTSIT